MNESDRKLLKEVVRQNLEVIRQNNALKSLLKANSRKTIKSRSRNNAYTPVVVDDADIKVFKGCKVVKNKFHEYTTVKGRGRNGRKLTLANGQVWIKGWKNSWKL